MVSGCYPELIFSPLNMGSALENTRLTSTHTPNLAILTPIFSQDVPDCTQLYPETFFRVQNEVFLLETKGLHQRTPQILCLANPRNFSLSSSCGELRIVVLLSFRLLMDTDFPSGEAYPLISETSVVSASIEVRTTKH